MHNGTSLSANVNLFCKAPAKHGSRLSVRGLSLCLSPHAVKGDKSKPKISSPNVYGGIRLVSFLASLAVILSGARVVRFSSILEVFPNISQMFGGHGDLFEMLRIRMTHNRFSNQQITGFRSQAINR